MHPILASLLFIALPGCILPLVPPPPQVGAPPPYAALGPEEARRDFNLHLGWLPEGLNGSYAEDLAGPLAMELGGQFGLAYASVAPALWIRGGAHQHAGSHVGLRIGGLLGSGDILGLAPFTYPYGGLSAHLQYVAGWGETGAFSLNVGANAAAHFGLLMIDNFNMGQGVDEETGAPILLVPVPYLYPAIHFRFDFPIYERATLNLAAGYPFAVQVGAGW